MKNLHIINMNNTVVYRHLKPDGEVFYIGIGNEKRPYHKNNRSKWWKRVVKKYPDYEVQVLKKDLSWKDACELEKILIDYYGRKNLGLGTLVNMTDGGEGSVGFKHSEETRQKMSDVKSGENAPWFGKKLYEETRKKLSVANKGKKHSEESKQKMSAAKQNMSQETKQKMSAAKQNMSEKTKQKMSAAKQKLTYEQAEEIRKRYKTEKITQQKLGQEYGVVASVISNIIKNKTYNYKENL